MALVLASASPRRRELLERVGILVDVQPMDVAERVAPGEAPRAYAKRVAATKADVAAAQLPGRWVLAADTIVEIDGNVLGKPTEPAEAKGMLERLRGRVHRVTTAFAIRGPNGARYDESVTTEVRLVELHDADLAGYVASGEWKGKAGGYAVQGMAAAMVAECHGSITNVIGLPLAEV